MTTKELLWKFEAFREYVSFEVLQPAAAVLNLFEGEFISESNPQIKKLERLLVERTGRNSWKPNRSGTPDLNWNSEGDFTRNKERLLTSMLIMYPKEFEDGYLRLTDFGKALATGRVSKESFYEFIVRNFHYPHPAYQDNWNNWRESGRELYPFVFIIQVLIELYNIGREQCYLTVKEAEFILVPASDHRLVGNIVHEIIGSRRADSFKSIKSQGDKITRKITDIFGFLCISGYACYLNNNDISLNLHGVHSEELTHFYFQRNPQSKLKQNRMEYLQSLVSKIKALEGK